MKRLIHWSLHLLIAIQLVSCSLNPTKPAPAVRELDVPTAARDDDEPLRHRLVVLPFTTKAGVDVGESLESIRRTFLRELNQEGHYVLINSEDLREDLNGLRNNNGEYDMAAVAKLGLTAGGTAVLEGRVESVQVKRSGSAVGLFRQVKSKVVATVRFRMFATRNGREILNQVKSSELEDGNTRFVDRSARTPEEDAAAVKEAVQIAFLNIMPLVGQTLDKLVWEGRVALISGERIFLNAGRLSGLQVGDILKVTEEGEEVYDPQSGRFIGKAPGRMKGTVEVVSYFGKDGAIAIVLSGSGFKENDRVEAY